MSKSAGTLGGATTHDKRIRWAFACKIFAFIAPKGLTADHRTWISGFGGIAASGVSAHSLYTWRKKYASDVGKGDEQADEIRQLKRELARVTEERDILKEAAAYFAKDAK